MTSIFTVLSGSLILATFHETIPKPVVYPFLVLGVPLFIAAFIKDGAKIGNWSIPSIPSLSGRIFAGIFGVLIVVAVCVVISAQAWSDRLDSLENSLNQKSTTGAGGVAFELDRLVVDAGYSSFRNRRLCDFIAEYKLPFPNEVNERIAQANGKNANAALSCYQKLNNQQLVTLNSVQLKITNSAASTKAPATPSVRSESPLSLSVKPQSVRIVKAATQAGEIGWMYLGRADAAGRLTQATIFEQVPNQGQVVRATTDVKLHDQNAGGSRLADSPITGLISRGSLLRILELRKTMSQFLWARVDLLRNADTGESLVGFKSSRLVDCPVREDQPGAVRTNETLWIVAGTKESGSDRLFDANVDAFCLPRQGETVTVIRPTAVYKGWDPNYTGLTGRDRLAPTGQTLPDLTRVEVTTALGAIKKGAAFEVYLPITIVSRP